jgi:hypothetical protein
MLPGNMDMAEGYLRIFKLILMHCCHVDEVADARAEQWAPDMRELMRRTDALQRRTTSALLLEQLHGYVEHLTSSRVRRRGRWLLGVWTARLQRELGGMVLDYCETRSPEEMQCVPYFYVPMALDGESGRLEKYDTPAGGLACADDCDAVPADARWLSDWRRTWPGFEPSDTWQWN